MKHFPRLFPMLAAAALLPLAACGPLFGSRNYDTSSLPSVFRAPSDLDWERTIPVLVVSDEPGSVREQPASRATVDLLEYCAGWIDGLEVARVAPAEDFARIAVAAGPAGDAPAAPTLTLSEGRRIDVAPASAPGPSTRRGGLSGNALSTVTATTAAAAVAPRFWFAAIAFRTDTASHGVHRVIALSDAPLSDAGLAPIPFELDPRIGESDGGFARVDLRAGAGSAADSADPADPLQPESLRILFGNEFLPLTVVAAPGSSASTIATPPAVPTPALRVEWLGPDRFVVRGLRDLAPLRGSDSVLRLFAKTESGRWVASEFAFGGRLRPVFEPRDSVYYFALLDRLPNGDPTNDAPLPPSSGVAPLDNWAGGDTAGLRTLIESRYFKGFDSGCLVLSPPYRQAEGAVEIAASASGGAKDAKVMRPVAGYRGAFAASFGQTEPRSGDLGAWIDLVAAAHRAGLNVMLEYNPWAMHESADLVKSDPEWFRGAAPELGGSEGAGSDSANSDGAKAEGDGGTRAELDRSEFLAPSLRYGSWAVQPDGPSAFAGYGIWWLRTLNADGLRFTGGERLAPDALSLFATRLREEIVRPARRGVYVLGDPLFPAAASDDPARAGDDPARAAAGPADSQAANPASGLASGPAARYPLPPSLDGAIDYPLSLAIRDGLAGGTIRLSDLDAAVHASMAQRPIGSIPCVVSGSPDLPRLASLGDSDRAHRLALAALFTLPAAPGIYYGDEIGMTGSAIPENRAPLPDRSTWSREERRRFQWALELADLRFHHPALRRGGFQTLAASEDVWVFARVTWSEAVVVAFNRSAESRSVEIEWPGNLASARRLSPLIKGDGIGTVGVEGNRATLALPPGGVGIWGVR